jgi:glycine/D-amino acid oxidase-like deaminating enzyme/nitrite reductase/ring-hydroxylating ferredoxin subunit
MGTNIPRKQSLKRDAQADVCVVGAGIAGLTTAYLLVCEGKSVILLDDGPIAGGQTERTSAHLSNAIDDRFSELENIHGAEVSRLAAESHAAAIDQIETIANEEGIDCEFARVDGYLFLDAGQNADVLNEERRAARRAGLHGVDFVRRAPISSFDTGPCLRFPRQAQFHPLKYMAGLVESYLMKGGIIHANTHVSTIDGNRVVTNAGPKITAGSVVVATNTPVNDLLAIHTKQAPYLTYAIGAQVPRGSVEQALYWDTHDPYHYIRIESGRYDDILIVGGEDHKAGQASDEIERWDRLEDWTKERFPMMGAIEYRWSGMVMETIDGLAFIGRNPADQENVYIATGDSGMGLTHGTIAGILLTDLILERANPWEKIYDPTRKPIRGKAGREFLVENANVAAEYIKDWIGVDNVSSTDDIPCGEGAIIRRGIKPIAVYRDERGLTHELSAVCPHLGCVVHWNRAEKTWDCPCHGSRFTHDGQVVVGPANSPLSDTSSS